MDFMSKEEFATLSPEQQKELLKKIEEVKALTKMTGTEDEGLKKLDMKEFEAKVKNVAENYIKSMTNVDRKYFAFPGIGKDLLDNNSPEGKFVKTTRFLKAMIGADVQVLRDMHEETRKKANLSEGSTTAGGFLVPEEFKAEVLRVAAQYGVIRRECRIIPMAYDVVNIPAAGTTDQSAIWTNEAAQILQTNPTFRQCVLTINKLAAIPKVTNELLADANVNVIQYLSEIIGEAFAKAEDQQGFCGIGSPFVGCLSATGVPTTPQAGGTAAQSLSYQDLINATGNIYTNLGGNAKFYFHRTMGAHIRGLITTAGAPVFGAVANEIAGYPFILGEALPFKANAVSAGTAYAIFGDLRKGLAMGERGSITMKLSEEATVDSDNLFEKDMAALRMIERVAIGVLLPSAFSRITTAAA
jgi:HK97 family phage major capsid protein